MQLLPFRGWGFFVIAVAGAMAVAAALGVAINGALYKTLERKGATSFLVIIASLGVSVVTTNGLAIAFGNSNISLDLGLTGAPLTIGTFGVSLTQQIGFPLLTAVLCCLWFWYRQTEAGRWARATGVDPVVVEALGHSSRKSVAVVYALASAGVVFPALFIGASSGVSPAMGDIPILFGVMAVIFGGLGRFLGWAAGGIAIGLLQNLSAAWVDTSWTDAVAFVLIVGAMMVFPRGLFGGRSVRYV
jgi:branched-chain amino acid transport system permease protein